ncbi:serine hydrolase domain-containing protein [Thermomonospora umbrina]|uniref:D-alanyl-D-alanine carboxypeptidase n=1 Tax=Thermomonospora umbrina TaxID=111806 RepID=A0A3D9SZL1_9ACTN|nr:serine hydrolase domain-containing protein [Thermomonospora umbrina]REE97051.1 D-alanyl-D-alanine carboxypeptidase [Thermomonospora umbrina]
MLTTLATAVTLTATLIAPPHHSALRDVVHRLTAEDGAPGALAEVHDHRRGRTVVTSGVADLETRAPVSPRSHFRIGSLTKPFVATVVLQLVGEGRVALDEPIERHLPGVVRGGNDGREITVRHLLQQTSGLPDVLEHLTPQQIIEDPLRHWEPRELLAVALEHPRLFPPGDRWAYSSTNYLLAGLLIESVTGRPYGEEIRRRVLRPLRLNHTQVPGDTVDLPRPHTRGYVRAGARTLDLTRLNPTVAWAGGEMVSTASDVNTFLRALVGGRLLRPAEQRALKTTRPTGRPSGALYGLGLQWNPSRCGGYWGHGGDMLGFSTRTGATDDGRQVTVMANLNPGATDAQKTHLNEAVPTALCD